MPLTWFWLAAALAFAVGEALTTAFYALFIVIGAIAAAVAAQLGFDLPVQVVVMCVVSVLGVAVARPPLMRYLQQRHTPEMASGAESMVGHEAPVVDEIGGPHQPGHVRVYGENWPAVSEDGTPIAAGTIVMVVGLQQTTLIVRPIQEVPAPTPVAKEG
jgi:membrane protein implicated in regulation of membrane protease activity